jgi:hypothetical protein
MLTMMLLLVVAALGLGFDWQNQSADEARNGDNAKTFKEK